MANESHQCVEDLFEMANAESNQMHGVAGAMAVTEQAVPPIVAAEFPPSGLTCPHGVHFWVYPNAERIAALRAMNERGSDR